MRASSRGASASRRAGAVGRGLRGGRERGGHHHQVGGAGLPRRVARRGRARQRRRREFRDRREVDARHRSARGGESDRSRRAGQGGGGRASRLVAAGTLAWSDIRGSAISSTGKAEGRTSPSDLTLFKSLGIALEDGGLVWWARAHRRLWRRPDPVYPTTHADLQRSRCCASR